MTRLLNKYIRLIFITSGLLLSFTTSQAHAALCNSLNDMVLAEGCSFKSVGGYEGDIGEVIVYALPNTTGTTRFQKVVYIAEPFAVLEDHSRADIINTLGSDTSGSLVNNLLSSGFDIVVFSYPGALNDTYLQRKAYGMETALEQIRSWRLQANLDNDFYKETMIGLSLGGVISRYALAHMESQGIEHGIDTYISVDSPHGGSNVPLSLQRTLRFITNGFQKISGDNQTWYNKAGAWTLSRIGYDETSRSLDSLTGFKLQAMASLRDIETVAVKQLAINHYSAAGSHELKDQLQSELNLLGFPQKTKNIAIVNGSLNGGLIPHTHHMYLQADTPTKDSSNWDINAATTNSSNINFNARLRYPKKYWTGTEIKYYRANWGMEGYANIDEGVCSSTSLPAQFIESMNEFFFNKYDDYQAQTLDQNSCFIPIASALGISTNNYNAVPNLADSDFDVIWGGNDIETHLELDPYVSDIYAESTQIPGWFVPVMTLTLL